MSDEGRINAAVSIELLFERKDDQSLIDIFADQLHAALTPGPELRRHVVHRRNSALLHLSRHAPVECRRVNHDRQIGLAAVRFIDQMLVDVENSGQMAEDLGDSYDRKVLCIYDNFASGGIHPVATYSKKIQRRIKPTQRFNQLSAVHLPRSFTRRDQDSQAKIVAMTS